MEAGGGVVEEAGGAASVKAKEGEGEGARRSAVYVRVCRE